MEVLVGRASNKGGRGKRNREEIGAGAMKNRLHGRAFLSLKWSFTVFFMGEMPWQFFQQILAIAWSLLSFLWSKKKCPYRKPLWSQFRPNFGKILKLLKWVEGSGNWKRHESGQAVLIFLTPSPLVRALCGRFSGSVVLPTKLPCYEG